MKLVMLVTSQVKKGLDVALAWQEAGAPGLTIIRSHGLYNLQRAMHHGEIELPRMVSSMAGALAHIIDNVDESVQIFLSVVEPDMVDKLITAANTILGDLTEPDHGILLVLDVERAIGVRDHRQKPPS